MILSIGGCGSSAQYLISRSLLKAATRNKQTQLCSDYLTAKNASVAWCGHKRHQSSQANERKTKEKIPNMVDRKTKLITIPNVLTSSRILITPAIGYFIWHEMHLYALSCFTIAALTDLADGYIARHTNQCSDIGAILDPVADKLLLTTCFVSLYHVDLMPIWLVGSFIFRDIALLSGGIVLRYKSFTSSPGLKQYMNFNKYPAPDFEPTLLSKCNTALQCSLIVTHLGTNHLIGSLPYYDLFVTCIHALTASTTLASFGQYLFRALNKKTSFAIKLKEPDKR